MTLILSELLYNIIKVSIVLFRKLLWCLCDILVWFLLLWSLFHRLATGNGVCEDAHIRDIYSMLDDAQIFGTNIGSLVTGNSRRPTEHVKVHKPYQLPSWWDDFWMNYKELYPQFKSPERYAVIPSIWYLLLHSSAEDTLFVNGRFTQSTLEQCLQVLSLSISESIHH
jgi:hypothetical protein